MDAKSQQNLAYRAGNLQTKIIAAITLASGVAAIVIEFAPTDGRLVGVPVRLVSQIPILAGLGGIPAYMLGSSLRRGSAVFRRGFIVKRERPIAFGAYCGLCSMAALLFLGGAFAATWQFLRLARVI